MKTFVLDFKNVGLKDFILFWRDYYNEGKYSDKDYLFHLRKGGLLEAEDLLYLLQWKNAGPLSQKKMGIYNAAKENLDRLNGFRKKQSIDSDEVVELFSVVSDIIRTGLIWRVFLMHVTRPDDFPMFDQHVYRAFTFLQEGQITDRSFSEKDINLYLDYFSFVRKVEEETSLDLRTIDKAFFAFGKFIKEYKRQITKSLSLTR